MSEKVLSLTNKVWEILNPQESFSNPADFFNLILQNRGISDTESFKKISLKNSMPDPFVFVDMEKAVKRIVQAINSGQKITILGDYDVDGVSSTVLLMKFFDHVGVSFSYSIPNRMEEGYGFSIQNLENNKGNLIIAVDCGSSSFAELDYAIKNNIEVIVLDHHKMERIPEAAAIVNPHRPDEKETYRYLCAAGVVFMCIVGINRQLRNDGFYLKRKIIEPDLIYYLDLVALATVCDVMPLINLNRAFVRAGLKIISHRKNLGIDALVKLNKNSSATAKISSDTIAFFFGPRINAAGRIDLADLSVRLLFSKNRAEAEKLAQKLDDLNKQRQSIEQDILEEAEEKINASVKQEERENQKFNFICVSGKDWHLGVVGIVAGRLKEKYNVPTFVIAVNEKDKVGRCSCRSVPEVDVSAIINKAIERGIVKFGGGHSLAGGFTIDASQINCFVDFLRDEIKYIPQQKILIADGYIPIEMISFDVLEEISKVAPFGNGNPHPKFVIPNVKIISSKIVGANHVHLCLESLSGHKRLSAIAFRCSDTELGKILLSCNEKDAVFQIFGNLSVSEWNDTKYINFVVEDIASGHC